MSVNVPHSNSEIRRLGFYKPQIVKFRGGDKWIAMYESATFTRVSGYDTATVWFDTWRDAVDWVMRCLKTDADGWCIFRNSQDPQDFISDLYR